MEGLGKVLVVFIARFISKTVIVIHESFFGGLCIWAIFNFFAPYVLSNEVTLTLPQALLFCVIYNTAFNESLNEVVNRTITVDSLV